MKSDFELMAKFKSGDPAAFHALARRHHVSVYNFFLMLTGRETAAQELTRGIFEQLVADRYRLPLERKFSTSLYRLGYSRWVAFEQSGGNRRHEPDAPATQEADKLEQIAAQKESLRLLALLPRELKFLMVLSETLRLSFREIAEILDISEEAVARRLSDTYGILTGSLQQPALEAPKIVPPPPRAQAQLPAPQTPLPSEPVVPPTPEAASSGEYPTGSSGATGEKAE